MAEQHRATADEWVYVKEHNYLAFSCLIELRDRIEALEAAQPNHPAKPDSSLVERVAFAIIGDSDELINWKPEPRAAIREVVAWLLKHYGGPTATTYLLEEEAKR